MGPETKERLWSSLAVLVAWMVGAVLLTLTAIVYSDLAAIMLFVAFVAIANFLIAWCWPEDSGKKKVLAKS